MLKTILGLTHRVPNFILLFMGGVFLGLAFAPVFFVPGLFSLSYLLSKLSDLNSPKEGFKTGYIFGLGFFLTILYWIAFGVSVYADEFWWAIPFALIGLPAFMAIFIGFVSYGTVIYKIRSEKYSKGYIDADDIEQEKSLSKRLSHKLKKNIFPNLQIVFCLIWISYELVSEWIFSGLPWGLLGYSLSFWTPLIQPASIFGVYGLSFISCYIATSIYSKKYLYSKIVISLLIISSSLIFGLVRLENNPTKYTDIPIRIVQASIPQTDKWNISDIWFNIDKHLRLSISDSSELKGNSNHNSLFIPDIIVWPEAALVIPYYSSPELMDEILNVLSYQNNKSTLLITGSVSDNGLSYGSEGFKMYSSMVGLSNVLIKQITQLENNQEQLGQNELGNKSSPQKIFETSQGNLYLVFEYHKSHLVPFGEYIPMKSLLPIKKLTPGLVDYSPGNFEIIKLAQDPDMKNSENADSKDSNRLLRKLASDRKVLGDLGAQDRKYFDVHEDMSTKSTHQSPAEVEFSKKSNNSQMLNFSFRPQICYESIFPSEMQTSNKDANVIINITNDAWYGNSSGPYQHFEIARMRAVENGIPMIRSANNGISAFVDPLGRVLSSLKLNEIAVLDSLLPEKIMSPTPFSEHGKYALLLLILVIGLIDYLTQLKNCSLK